MAKPIVEPIKIFDADIGTTVYFSIGNTWYTSAEKYEYRIIDSSTGVEIYTSPEMSYAPSVSSDRYYILVNKETVPSIANQKGLYYFQVRVKPGTEIVSTQYFSDWSEPTYFYCKEKPILSFQGISASTSNIVSTYATVLELRYTANQDEAETLKSYQYYFYDSNKKLIESSNKYYGSVSKTFSQYNLENGVTYYVRGTGETKNGYELDTGYYRIDVKYSEVSNAYSLEATNNYQKGCVEVTSHFISIEGIPSGDYSFVTDSNGATSIDLTNGSIVTYNISNEKDTRNYVLKYIVKVKPYITVSKIIFGENSYGVLSLNMRNQYVYASLNIYATDDICYYVKSDSLYYDDSLEYISIVIQCVNGAFDVGISQINTLERKVVE